MAGGQADIARWGSGRSWSRFDTPETHHPRKPVQCYGPEASAYTARRRFGQMVGLEDDVEHHDIYGRRLAYVYLHGRNFEEELREGDARLFVIEPNHAHARAMLDEELNARARRVGLSGVPAEPFPTGLALGSPQFASVCDP